MATSQHTQPSIKAYTQHASKPSFADITKSKIVPHTEFNYPDKKQAIIFKHIENVKILDYLKAFLSVIIEPKAVVAASRVSNNRVIIFLDSVDRVQNLLLNHKSFQLGDKTIYIHRLRSPTSKIILSNVSPTIPNEVLQEYLTKNLQLECTSPISILRVNPSDDLFSHVISWRRQVYVKSQPNWNLPSSFSIDYNNRTYRIFITFDEYTCFKCHKTGHKAEDCLKTVDLGLGSDWSGDTDMSTHNNPNTLSSSFPFLHSSPATSPSTSVEGSENTDTPQAIPIADSVTVPSSPTYHESINQPTTEAQKRRLSETSLASSLPPPTQAPKKSKEEISSLPGDQSGTFTESEDDAEESTEQQTHTLSLKQIFDPLITHYQEQQSTYPLSFQNFITFIDMCKGKQNLSSLLNDFGLDTKIKDLMLCIKECRLHIKHSSTKGRLTRIYKKLEQLQQQANPPGEPQRQQPPGNLSA